MAKPSPHRTPTSQTNILLLHTSRLLSSTKGLNHTLSTLHFTTTLLHSALLHRLSTHYETLAETLASTTTSLSLPPTPPPTTLTTACTAVKALADASKETWTFLRLFALLHIYRHAHALYAHPPRDPIIKLLLWARVGAGTGFQVLENAAVLVGGGRARRWTVLAWRLWVVRGLLEGLRLLRVRQLGWEEEFGAQEEKVEVQSEALRKRWWREVLANVGWLGVALRWSFEEEELSPVSEGWVGVCGLVSSLVGLRGAWEESA